jgi:uncharacterized protein YjiS (DUF1127 family)
MQTITTVSFQPSLASIARRGLRAIASTLSQAHQAWLNDRRARATARLLGLLDARLLHDIGLDRSELSSAAAELHGQAERQRRHALAATQLPR